MLDNAECEIIGYEDQDGTFCLECWKEMGKVNDDTVEVITADMFEDEDEPIVCDECGEVLWGEAGRI